MEKSQLPLYKCIKKVRAFKIESIEYKHPNMEPDSVCERCSTAILKSATLNIEHEVPIDYVNKHKPEEGGWYVLYDDSYESYSPAKAFEEGYILLQNNVQDKFKRGDRVRIVEEKCYDACDKIYVVVDANDGTGFAPVVVAPSLNSDDTDYYEEEDLELVQE